MPHRRPHASRLSAAAILGAAALVTSGCASNTVQAYRADLTPRLDARGQSHDDIQNQIAITNDTNFRNINNDLGRLFFTDRPSRLTIGPKPR